MFVYCVLTIKYILFSIFFTINIVFLYFQTHPIIDKISFFGFLLLLIVTNYKKTQKCCRKIETIYFAQTKHSQKNIGIICIVYMANVYNLKYD
jgi:hypothetical protein